MLQTSGIILFWRSLLQFANKVHAHVFRFNGKMLRGNAAEQDTKLDGNISTIFLIYCGFIGISTIWFCVELLYGLIRRQYWRYKVLNCVSRIRKCRWGKINLGTFVRLYYLLFRYISFHLKLVNWQWDAFSFSF